MIETSAKFILIFVVACCWSCSTRQNESNQRSNNTSLQNRDTLNEGYQPLMNPYYLEDTDASPQQKSFNDLFINFNKFSESSERIVYEVSYDLGAQKLLVISKRVSSSTTRSKHRKKEDTLLLSSFM
jgi:hypothetical protein